jgi:aspartyl-tRNA(Asn)/glutamyl-tRNA(Gln) amidotransferase subunit C
VIGRISMEIDPLDSAPPEPDSGGLPVDAVALLARLELTDEERELMGGQLRSILAHVDQLASLDTEDVPATRHPLPLETPFRADEMGEHLSRDQALANAPDTDGTSFIVPRVV